MSTPFHYILVPVDFSPHSAEALRYAATFVDQFTASLLVLHVLPNEPEPATRSGSLASSDIGFRSLSCASHHPVTTHMARDRIGVGLRTRAYEALQGFLPPELDQGQVELRVLSGHPCEEILFLARQEQVDLIVMGTHGRVGLEYMALGSIAEQIVCKAICPVFTVKSPSPFSDHIVR